MSGRELRTCRIDSMLILGFVGQVALTFSRTKTEGNLAQQFCLDVYIKHLFYCDNMYFEE